MIETTKFAVELEFITDILGAVKMLLSRGLQALNEVMSNDNNAEKAEVTLHE